MAKYSFEFKKKVVLEYINGEGGTKYLSTKYGLGSNSQLRKWLAAYKEFGDEGLKRSRKKENYSFEKKIGTVAPNRIRRRFDTHIPHQKITTDTSEFKYYEIDEKGHVTMHKLYLDPFMDIVKISRIFHVSLDDLLKEGEAGVANKTDEQITLEDLMKINLHNRKMTLLLISGLIFIMVSILNFAYVIALQSTTLSTQYMLYRYIVTGQYENAPIDYMRLMIPSIIAAAIGVILFISYTIERRKKGD